jgi:hypothetical protein
MDWRSPGKTGREAQSPPGETGLTPAGQKWSMVRVNG